MMKLTVAFLATLAAADAAQSHGRRHVRRQYGAELPYSLPGTGVPAVPSSTPTPAPSSPAAAVPSSSGLPYFPGEGTAPAIPASSVAEPASSGSSLPYIPGSSGTAPAGYPVIPASSVAEPLESSAYGTGFPTTAAPATPTGYNGTELVTSTVYSTMTLTVTACPAYGDCPAESTKVVTSVVPVGVTSYPKPTPADEYETIETSVSEVTHTITQTLTYTVGTGENAHPVTTEISSTSTETIYQTVTITKQHEASPTDVYGEDEEITGTTTLTTTSTTTHYITVHPTPSAGSEGEYPAGEYPAGGPQKEENEGDCQALPPVTVTVTAQETVTVTAGQEYPASSAAQNNEVPSSSAPILTAEYPASSAAVPSEKPTTVIPVTVSVVPYPIGNGTEPNVPGSTGFVTYTKPGAPYGTAPAVVPSSSLPADSQLPSFTLPASVDKVPSSVAYPTQESSAAVPTAAPSDSYGPGYRKRFGFF